MDGADGTTWTWTTGTATTFRLVGVASTLADLRVGERITVTGLIDGTSRHAESIVSLADPSVVTVARTAGFVTVDRTETLRGHERSNHCEHTVIQHGRGEQCEHHGDSRGGRGDHGDRGDRGDRGGRGGRHRL